MNPTAITNRFTLHDLFGYIFSGSLVLLAFWSLATLSNIETKSPSIEKIVTAFRQLHLTAQLAGISAVTYFVGLVCVSIGDICYNCIYRNSNRPPDILWQDRGKLSLTPKMKDRFKEKLRKLVGDKGVLSKQEQVDLAYSYLINTGKDRFVQLMSGRQAMFNGLAGASVVILLGTLLGWYNASVCWSVTVCSSVACFCTLAWSVVNARRYAAWWCHHVVHATLAAPLLDHAKAGQMKGGAG